MIAHPLHARPQRPHRCGARRWRSWTGAPIWLHPADAPLWGMAHPDRQPDAELHAGQVLTIAGVDVQVLHTPGHSPGAVCLYVPALGVLFSGDTLFAGGPGRDRAVVLGLPDDHRLDLAPAAEPAAGDRRAHRPRCRHHDRRRGAAPGRLGGPRALIRLRRPVADRSAVPASNSGIVAVDGQSCTHRRIGRLTGAGSPRRSAAGAVARSPGQPSAEPGVTARRGVGAHDGHWRPSPHDPIARPWRRSCVRSTAGSRRPLAGTAGRRMLGDGDRSPPPTNADQLTGRSCGEIDRSCMLVAARGAALIGVDQVAASAASALLSSALTDPMRRHVFAPDAGAVSSAAVVRTQAATSASSRVQHRTRLLEPDQTCCRRESSARLIAVLAFIMVCPRLVGGRSARPVACV